MCAGAPHVPPLYVQTPANLLEVLRIVCHGTSEGDPRFIYEYAAWSFLIFNKKRWFTHLFSFSLTTIKLMAQIKKQKSSKSSHLRSWNQRPCFIKPQLDSSVRDHLLKYEKIRLITVMGRLPQLASMCHISMASATTG